MATAITLAATLAPAMENVVFVVLFKVTPFVMLIVLLIGPRPATEEGGKPGTLGRMSRCGGGGANEDQCPE